EIEVDSAGTAGWHIGKPPDQRAVEEAARHGVSVMHRGRQFTARDFADYDLVLVMDHDNHAQLLPLATHDDVAGKIHFLRSFDPDAAGDNEIADPYYGSAEDFTKAFEQIQASCRGLLEHLRREHLRE